MSDQFKYVSGEGLEVKKGQKYEIRFSGVSAFIKTVLEKIPAGQAMRLVELRDTIMQQYPEMTKDIAYDKIHFALQSKWGQEWKKMERKSDGVTFVARAAVKK